MASRRGSGSFSMAGLGSRPSSGDTELTLGQSLQQRAPVGSARAVASTRPAPAPCAPAVRLTPAVGAVHCVPRPSNREGRVCSPASDAVTPVCLVCRVTQGAARRHPVWQPREVLSSPKRGPTEGGNQGHLCGQTLNACLVWDPLGKQSTVQFMPGPTRRAVPALALGGEAGAETGQTPKGTVGAPDSWPDPALGSATRDRRPQTQAGCRPRGSMAEKEACHCQPRLPGEAPVRGAEGLHQSWAVLCPPRLTRH